MEKGYVHVYTGNGKGKTTAALGLCLRALGAGLKVYIGQFIKDEDSCEITALRKLAPDVTVEQYGNGLGLVHEGDDLSEHTLAAKSGYRKAIEALISGKYDVVILDEINVAGKFGLISVRDIAELIKQKPAAVDLVLTGRYASLEIIEKADLVTEMKEIKHYYNSGVGARKGIEE